jgi:DNA-binding NarL/FixJ family response regulator
MSFRAYVVEDHDDLRELVASYLASRPEIEVCGAAANAETALDEIPALRPDIAIIDVSLPRIDGIELVRRLRKLRPDLLMIMLSGHLDSAYVEAAQEAGARAYVAKGNILELAKALNDTLPSKP